MKRHAVLLVAVAAVLLAAHAPAREETKNPHLWEPRTRTVAVFKNGLGFFLQEGQATLREGWAVAADIPPAAFGTLAIFARDEGTHVDLVGAGPGEVVAFDGVDVPDDLETRRARLEAARGLTVQLDYDGGRGTLSVTGKLVHADGDYAILETADSTLAVPIAKIARLQYRETPLRVHVEGAADSDNVTLARAYLTHGITWVPEYTLRQLDDGWAELTLRGTLINEAEDLIHCDVNFVVGVPHFVHSEHMAPIAVGRQFRALAGAVFPSQVTSQMLSNAMLTSPDVSAMQGGGPSFGEIMGGLPGLPAGAAGDYTVYTKRDLTVRRGEKAIVTLFVRRIRTSHLYRWTAPGTIGHSLVLHNTTDSAWTTGPCLVMQGDTPLGEDLLAYTPLGGNGEVPIATAVNLRTRLQETEVEREVKKVTYAHDAHLDRVVVAGEAVVENYEKDTVEIVVTIPIAGHPLEADRGGQLVRDTQELRLAERHGSVSWRLKIEPGETVTLNYRYERYVPTR